MKLKYYINEEAQKEIKSKMVDRKGSKCILCGYNKFQGALQFHHIEEKEDLATKIFGSKKQITQDPNEAKRTILLCANCHAEVTGGLHPELFKKVKNQNDLDFDEELDTEVFYKTTNHLPTKKFVNKINKYLEDDKNLSDLKSNKTFLRQMIFALKKRIGGLKKDSTERIQNYESIKEIFKKIGYNGSYADFEKKDINKIRLKKEHPIENEKNPTEENLSDIKNAFYFLIEKTFTENISTSFLKAFKKLAEKIKLN